MANDPKSMVAQELGSDGYSLTEHLLFLIVDALRAANWQRGGKKSAPRPKPVSPLAQPEQERIGHTTRSPEEVAALLRTIGPEGSDDDGD